MNGGITYVFDVTNLLDERCNLSARERCEDQRLCACPHVPMQFHLWLYSPLIAFPLACNSRGRCHLGADLRAREADATKEEEP